MKMADDDNLDAEGNPDPEYTWKPCPTTGCSQRAGHGGSCDANE